VSLILLSFIIFFISLKKESYLFLSNILDSSELLILILISTLPLIILFFTKFLISFSIPPISKLDFKLKSKNLEFSDLVSISIE
jgi:hypothetical protein